METVEFHVFEPADVPSALDPARRVTINAGVWPVNFDEIISRTGSAPECEVVEPNIRTTRILRSDLMQLCKDGKAARRNPEGV